MLSVLAPVGPGTQQPGEETTLIELHRGSGHHTVPCDNHRKARPDCIRTDPLDTSQSLDFLRGGCPGLTQKDVSE